jgi:hypothetical protein
VAEGAAGVEDGPAGKKSRPAQWISLGSEKEIEIENVYPTREKVEISF